MSPQVGPLPRAKLTEWDQTVVRAPNAMLRRAQGNTKDVPLLLRAVLYSSPLPIPTPAPTLHSTSTVQGSATEEPSEAITSTPTPSSFSTPASNSLEVTSPTPFPAVSPSETSTLEPTALQVSNSNDGPGAEGNQITATQGASSTSAPASGIQSLGDSPTQSENLLPDSSLETNSEATSYIRNENGFMKNKKEVAGTFTAVSLVILAIAIAVLVWWWKRRTRARKRDAWQTDTLVASFQAKRASSTTTLTPSLNQAYTALGKEFD
ncbi:hypothetical protein SCHPADRAFT_935188 [Schizopora paradoxa]|uniref:Uncharacterized protein n=1 Tax=Schizopora paradoxa TaxID=27342 RepID=A0A0H2S601_9AGAM|nr:hypothetical protein SCHPADRAFT_935188 [Schizopora paradoxa]